MESYVNKICVDNANIIPVLMRSLNGGTTSTSEQALQGGIIPLMMFSKSLLKKVDQKDIAQLVRNSMYCVCVCVCVCMLSLIHI